MHRRKPLRTSYNNFVGYCNDFERNIFGMITDIEKVFLQIGIQEAGLYITRFLQPKVVQKPVLKANLNVFRFAKLLLKTGPVHSYLVPQSKITSRKQKHQQSTKQRPTLRRKRSSISVNSENEAVELYHDVKALFNELKRMSDMLTESKVQIHPENQKQTKVTKVIKENKIKTQRT